MGTFINVNLTGYTKYSIKYLATRQFKIFKKSYRFVPLIRMSCKNLLNQLKSKHNKGILSEKCKKRQ